MGEEIPHGRDPQPAPPVSEPRYDSRIISCVQLAPKCLQVLLERPSGFTFLPGQYIWLVLPKRSPTPGIVDRRAYSISSGTQEDRIEIIIRTTDSDYLRAVGSLKSQDHVQIIGPFGSCFTPPVEGCIMLAGGLGVTPFLGILRSNPPGQFDLVAYFDPERPLPCDQELRGIDGRDSRTQVTIVPGAPTQETLSAITKVDDQRPIFICGPQGFIDGVAEILAQLNVDPTRARYEMFYPSHVSTRQALSAAFKEIEEPSTIVETFIIPLRQKIEKHIQQEIEKSKVYENISKLLEVGEVFALISEQTGSHVVLTDYAGQILFANAAAEMITGYSFAEMRGQTPRLWGGMMSTAYYQDLWLQEKQRRVIKSEVHNRRKDGRIYTAYATITSIVVDNKIIGYVATEEDITQRKSLEMELAEESAKSEAMLLTLDEGVIMVGRDGKVNYSNRAASDMTGYSNAELLGQILVDVLAAETQSGKSIAAMDRPITQAIATQKPFHSELVYVRKDGTRFIAEVALKPVFVHEMFLGDMEVFRDISQERQFIAERIQQEQKYHELFNRFLFATKSANIGVWEWDIANDVLIWEDSMYALYGINRDDFGGAYTAWRETIHPQDHEKAEKAIQEAINGIQPFDLKFRIVRKDGVVRYIHGMANIERGPDGKTTKMVGVNWDITREEEIDRAKSEFVSIASHQLRTPLSAIHWYTEILLDEDVGTLTSEQRKHLETIYKVDEHLIELVNSLLNVSRLELGTFAINPETIDIRTVIDEVLCELQPMVEKKGQTMTSSIDATITTIEYDPKLLHMIVLNLLSNAVKYTPDHGQVECAATPAEGGQITITVKDNGYGIPVQQHDKIFTKLFRADNIQKVSTEGTGLGLYVIKSVVEKTKGTITFVSAENQGTTFHVSLPIHAAKEPPSNES